MLAHDIASAVAALDLKVATPIMLALVQFFDRLAVRGQVERVIRLVAIAAIHPLSSAFPTVSQAVTQAIDAHLVA